jgi:hypothetical protein
MNNKRDDDFKDTKNIYTQYMYMYELFEDTKWITEGVNRRKTDITMAKNKKIKNK